jgi:hypothetical protein
VVLVVEDVVVVVEAVVVVVEEVVVDEVIALSVVEDPMGTVVVVVGSPDDITARKGRGVCPFAANVPVSVRQSGAMDAFRRTWDTLPHTGQRLVIRVPFGVTLTRPRRGGHGSIPTLRPWTTILSPAGPSGTEAIRSCP